MPLIPKELGLDKKIVGGIIREDSDKYLQKSKYEARQARPSFCKVATGAKVRLYNNQYLIPWISGKIKKIPASRLRKMGKVSGKIMAQKFNYAMKKMRIPFVESADGLLTVACLAALNVLAKPRTNAQMVLGMLVAVMAISTAITIGWTAIIVLVAMVALVAVPAIIGAAIRDNRLNNRKVE